MIRDTLIAHLSETEGASVASLLQTAGLPAEAESLAAVELLLRYSSDAVLDGDKWKVAQAGKSAMILASIRNYVASSGRKIFRLSSALAQIPAHDHPNEEELKAALDSSNGEFELLPNAMIKRN
jgi:hypothetical protein